MTVAQARMLQERYYKQHPLMRLMDLMYRIAAKGKPLWGTSDKPRQISDEKPEAVHETMAQTLVRLGWEPPKK